MAPHCKICGEGIYRIDVEPPRYTHRHPYTQMDHAVVLPDVQLTLEGVLA